MINVDQNTYLDINLKSIVKNYKSIKSRVSNNCTVAATVKANAYGLGIKPIAKNLIAHNCNIFFVATLTEGIELRKINKKIKIFVLNGLDIKKITLFDKYSLIPVINSLNQLKKAELFSLNKRKKINIALHFDTGMSRLGLDKDETKILLRKKKSLINYTEISLVMSHLSCADDPRNKKNKLQLERFIEISKHFPNTKLSLSNSAGILLGKKYHFDLVRPGISLYGGNCSINKKNIYNPVISLKAKIIQKRKIYKGETVGYGATYRAKKNMLIATIPIGYADGFNRHFIGKVNFYLKKKKVKIVGRVSMDLITIDISKFHKEKIRPDDYIEIINSKNNIDYLSRIIRTIPYEILTSLGNRYQRRYIA